MVATTFGGAPSALGLPSITETEPWLVKNEYELAA